MYNDECRAIKIISGPSVGRRSPIKRRLPRNKVEDKSGHLPNKYETKSVSLFMFAFHRANKVFQISLASDLYSDKDIDHCVDISR